MNFQRKFDFEFGFTESGSLLPDYSLDTSPLHEYHDRGFTPFPLTRYFLCAVRHICSKGTVQESDFQPASEVSFFFAE